MVKYSSLVIICLLSLYSFSQQIMVKKDDKYWEDQLYISVTYNTLTNQLSEVSDSGFSYGLGLGYIRDIPFNRKGKWALGVGAGYEFDYFNHGLHLNSQELFSLSSQTNDKMRLHNIEMPIQLRWRNSDAITYSFWRIYLGTRLSFNFYNSFKSNQGKVKNIKLYNNFQTGLELSVGYNSLNFYIYYGLSPLYKDAFLDGSTINTRMAKFGLIFYLL